MTTKAIYRKEYRIYKPKLSGDGAATKYQVKITPEGKVQAFLVASMQTGKDEKGNASFGWKDPTKYVTMKLGEVDISEILTVLNSKKKAAGPTPKDGEKPKGLFHKNNKGSTSLQFNRIDTGYSFRLASKNGNDLVAVSHMVSPAEGEILRILLEDTIRFIYSREN